MFLSDKLIELSIQAPLSSDGAVVDVIDPILFAVSDATVEAPDVANLETSPSFSGTLVNADIDLTNDSISYAVDDPNYDAGYLTRAKS